MVTRATDGRGRAAVAVVALALVSAIPASSRAAEEGSDAATADPSAGIDDVDARFRQGLTLFEEGSHVAAAAVWEQLLADLGAGRGWKLNYNLGLAYWSADRPTLAVERFEAFVSRVAAEASSLPEELEQRRADAAAKIGVIKAEHGAVVLPAASGVTARIDGERARAVGYTAYVKPGVHQVTVIGPTGEERQVPVEVMAGRQLIVDTSDPKPAPEPTVVAPRPSPVAPPPPEEPPSFPWIPVGIGAGLTAAGFVLPAVMFQRARGRFQDADELGAGHSGYSEARDDYDAARTAYHVSYALPAALGAITAAIAIYGAVNVATWEPAGDRAVTLRAGPGGAWLGGRF